ncbi:MAG: aldehyde ferredoxin oxidoreductase family protein [Deltaproteobacteria bacterium]|nr:aldehyde ferredoxin oxidoreductase family protein [Deltaproteobacteria bacterium]MBW2154045.1 aldehyde ferredoxin oxidoreductase family protein [Deltaproteobacteria bacterium]
MRNGYNAKILKVDLSQETFDVEEPDEFFYRTYLGGRGFASYYLLKELAPGIDAFDPENLLIFATSIIVGAPAPSICRYTVAGKSPLTGGFAESEAGGFWGPELKFAGFDAVVISGKAKRPSYLWIHDGKFEIRAADHLWGKISGEAEAEIRSELNEPMARVSVIGPAGERLVRYACIVNERSHANGRTGLGAVMGSKNLKAVVVRGTHKPKVYDMDPIRAVSKRVASEFKNHGLSKGLHYMGTPAAINHFQHLGTLPTRNFRYGEFEGAEEISGEKMTDTILIDRKGCYACPIRCKRVVQIESEKISVDPSYGGPEYETLSALGSLCEVSDLAVIAKAHELCNKYTMDVISTGVVIAWAMECFQEGLLTLKDTDGVELNFGNGELVLDLIEKIANREGIGNLLAEGIYRASKTVGRESLKFAVIVKAMECAIHDGRGKMSVALGYAISPKGPDHLIAPFDILFEQEQSLGFKSIAPLGILEPLDAFDFSWKKIRLHVYLSHLWSLYNCLGICNFGYAPRSIVSLNELVEIVKAVTGWDTSLWELIKAGERMTNMTRAFNLREGFSREDDTLPERFFEPFERGKLRGKRITREQFEEALNNYYDMMGWDRNGKPRRGKLRELNIDWVAEMIQVD